MRSGSGSNPTSASSLRLVAVTAGGSHQCVLVDDAASTRVRVAFVVLALAIGGLCQMGRAAEGKVKDAKASPTGVMSVTLADVPAPAQAGGLPPGFSESRMACQIAGMLAMREYGPAAKERAGKIVQRIRKTYDAIAADKAFASLPCALNPKLSGRAGSPRHYYLYVPEDYKPTRKHPLVLFLHGGGGNFLFGFHGAVQDARRNKFIVACPTFRNGDWWTPDGTAFALKVLADITGRYSVDEKSVLIGGVSNGAIGAWAISERHKKKFAGVICISGAFNGKKPVKAGKGPPLFIAHGAKDMVIPAVLSRNAFAVLKARKGTVYKEYPDHGHLVAIEKPEIGLPAALEWFKRLQDDRTAARRPTR